MKKLYFAYGSNMSQSRLEERVGTVIKVGTHRMNGFVMKFNAGNAYANLEMSPNDYDFVEGVLYELTPKQMKSLEKFEGFPFFYQKMVFPYKTTQFYTFISVNPRYKCSPKLLPTIEYLGHLTKGCRENKLARTLSYIQDLYKLPSKF